MKITIFTLIGVHEIIKGNVDENQGAVVVVIVWWMDLQLPVQLVPITTKVGNSNPAHGEEYSTQHYVIKFVSDMQQVAVVFSGFPPPIKLTATILM